MYIKRHVEAAIMDVSDMYAAVIITGPRQVGKTTVLKKVCKDLDYITLDNPDIMEYAKNETGLFFKTFKPPLALDEVQYAPELFPYIKMIADETQKKKMFFMTGSQNFHLMKNVSESLAGRIGIIHMLGLSLREILGKKRDEPFIPDSSYFKKAAAAMNNLSLLDIWKIIQRGSMPWLYQYDASEDTTRQFYSDYVRTYIERDVRALSQVGDEIAFLQFMRLLAASTGQMLNYSRIANENGKSVDTIKNWVSILRTSGLVYLLQPYYNNFNKRIVKTPKVYFMDTGLASYLTGWYTAEQLQFGAMSGRIFETFVVSEILKSFYNKGFDDFGFSYYRDRDMNEIDLIIDYNGVLYPVEIKKTGSPHKSDIKAFEKLKDNRQKQVGEGGIICMADTIKYLTPENRVIPLGAV